MKLFLFVTEFTFTPTFNCDRAISYHKSLKMAQSVGANYKHNTKRANWVKGKLQCGCNYFMWNGKGLGYARVNIFKLTDNDAESRVNPWSSGGWFVYTDVMLSRISHQMMEYATESFKAIVSGTTEHYTLYFNTQ